MRLAQGRPRGILRSSHGQGPHKAWDYALGVAAQGWPIRQVKLHDPFAFLAIKKRTFDPLIFVPGRLGGSLARHIMWVRERGVCGVFLHTNSLFCHMVARASITVHPLSCKGHALMSGAIESE